MTFIKATRSRVKLKLALSGPAGSGKSMSALRLATGFGGRIAFVDTENASGSLYADRFSFDTLDIRPPFDDIKFINAIDEAVKAGYDIIIIDSASHFWEGILDYKSSLDERGGNSYTNWNQAGKKYRKVMDAVLQSPIHVICCLRAKAEYVLEANERGKQVPKKVGMAPIMREGTDFEFAVVFDIDMTHNAKTTKDRSGLFSDRIEQITEETGKRLKAWVECGASPAVATPPTVAGKSPDIAKPKNAEWSDEQTKEAGSLRAELEALSGGKEAFSKLWKGMRHDPASSVIDALSAKLRELRDIEDQSQQSNTEEH